MTGKRRSMGSDLAKSDAHVIAPEEYGEIPELTEDDFARGVPHIGGRRVSWEEWEKAAIKAGWLASDKPKGGRPKSDNPKQVINLRVDADMLERFRAGGPGWQTRMNAALRKAARLPIARAAKKRAS